MQSDESLPSIIRGYLGENLQSESQSKTKFGEKARKIKPRNENKSKADNKKEWKEGNTK